MFNWLRRWRRSRRSGKWAAIRKQHLELFPACAACGREKEVDVHHLIPVSVDPSRECDPENLLTLCSDPCHLVWGHLMNYQKWNPLAKEDAARYRDRMRSFGVEAQ